MKDTAAEQAKGVANTAKDEAATVAAETKSQAKDLYAQTQRELKDQANTQQQRVAAGLRSVSSELDSMAAGSDQEGVATDLVRQASNRLSSAASWLGERDAGSLVTEVKRYARRQPGTFIAVAAIAGLAAGRLTRALAANATDDDANSTVSAAPSTGAERTPAPPVPDPPVFAPATHTTTTGYIPGGGDVRSDTF